MDKDNDEIVFPKGASLKIVTQYYPYTQWQLKRIAKALNWELVRICAYKEGRYPGYKNRYNIVDMNTQEILAKNVHLDDLRCIFARLEIGFPDEEISDILYCDGINKQAIKFNSIFNELVEKEKHT
ncbi:MAG: hypothetical protein PUB68_10830 [Lachnospiraceae bacterium]|nr:hypothetical protein [Lachnospiraceae bacterium]